MALALFFIACGGDDDGPGDVCSSPLGSQFLVYSYFNNGTPTLTLDEQQSTGDVITRDAVAFENNNEITLAVPGIRLRSNQVNFEVNTFRVDEKGVGELCFVNEAEFEVSASNVNSEVSSVLVLDMSSSITDIANDVKRLAKAYADSIVSTSANSQVAVVFFSSRNVIEATPFYTQANVAQLNNRIDGFNNFEERTALYQAVKTGIDLLEADNFTGEESLVVFTDGRDDDSNNPSQLIDEINASEINRFAIGLRTDDFRENNLTSIISSTSNLTIAETPTQLESVFGLVSREVTAVYDIVFTRSNQLLDETEAIEIRISFGAEVIR